MLAGSTSLAPELLALENQPGSLKYPYLPLLRPDLTIRPRAALRLSPFIFPIGLAPTSWATAQNPRGSAWTPAHVSLRVIRVLAQSSPVVWIYASHPRMAHFGVSACSPSANKWLCASQLVLAYVPRDIKKREITYKKPAWTRVPRPMVANATCQNRSGKSRMRVSLNKKVHVSGSKKT